MKQVLQNLKDGSTDIADVPTSNPAEGELLIATRSSLVSAGTERMLVEFGQAKLLQKARSQPDKVKAILESVRTDGILATVDGVRSKLDQPVPLGYSNVGRVIGQGGGVSGFEPGTRQVLAGLRAGKHVFCEKPLCLDEDELVDIAREGRSRPKQLLTVGFNRRFAPHTVKLKELMDTVTEPKSRIMTVKAGAIDEDHWTGKVVQLDNFRRMRGWGWSNFRRMNLWRQNKGHNACAHAFINALEAGTEDPIPLEEIIEVSRVTIELGEGLRA